MDCCCESGGCGLEKMGAEVALEMGVALETMSWY